MTAPQLAPGQQIAGRYKITGLLGLSNDATCFHATSSAGHHVAVKLYDPAIGQRADIMAKLERVRATLAELPSELVIPVLDAGYDPATSAPFSVCERQQSPSLNQALGSGPLPPSAVADLVEGVARALDAAHARQLFHLAIKPTNVFVTPGQRLVVRLADFGSSVVRSASPSHESYARSAAFLAPEQLNAAAVLGPATDVFATALLAFHSATGRSYWRACQSSTPDLAAWRNELVAPRMPASQRAAELGVAWPPAADMAFARAISLNQAERQGALTELAVALRGASAHAAMQAAPAKTMALEEFDPAMVAARAQQHRPTGGAYGASASGGYAPSPGGPGYGASASGHHAPHDPSASGRHVQHDPSASGRYVQGGAAASGGYGASASGGFGAAAGYPGGAHSGAPAGLPPTPFKPQKPPSKMAPIVGAIVAALVLGGAAVGYLFFVKRAEPDGPVVVPVVNTGGSVANGAGSAASSAELPGGATVPASSASGGATEPKEETVELLVTCVPQCDEIFVDNAKLERIAAENRLALLPGKHTVEGRKAGHGSVKELVVLELGTPAKRELRISKLGGAPGPGPVPAGPSKKPKCGRFVKRCN